MRRLAWLSVLLFASAALAADPVTGPAAFPRDTIASYKLPATGKVLVFSTPAGVKVVERPGEWLIAGKPGKYTIQGAWIDFDAKSAVAVELNFVVDGPADPPPTPVDPPKPADPVAASVAAAYAAEDSPTKAVDAAALAKVYARGISTLGTAKTAGDVAKDLKAFGDGLLSSTALPKVRATAGKYLAVALGTEPAALLTAQQRDDASALFLSLYLGLKGAK